jgi:hypothetical protein
MGLGCGLNLLLVVVEQMIDFSVPATLVALVYSRSIHRMCSVCKQNADRRCRKQQTADDYLLETKKSVK